MNTSTIAIPPTAADTPNDVDRRRWAILAVVCLAVFVTVLDGTIVNVALPSLSVQLSASTRQLQWIVDAYLLAFTGLLLAAGGLGDRFGRKKALLFGLAAFGATSAYAGSANGADALITGRTLMGIAAALIFPATLAILTNVFRDPIERAKAIGIWSASAGVAVAAGPIAGGWLLEHFWWGSVFYINVPVVAIAILVTWRLVPESKDSEAPRLDLAGFGFSILAIGSLVYTIIEAPEWGWLNTKTITGFTVAAALLLTFVWVERRVKQPMLPVSIFSDLRFTAASAAITSAFFALFGFIFLITQYFQLVRNYSPLTAGIRTLPVAFAIAIASVTGPRIVERIGTTRVVTGGLLSMAAAFVWISQSADVHTPYLIIAGQMILLGGGLGFTTAPATESIMGSLTTDKAGIGSAVNDTTRELGGTLGVAIVGSVFSSIYIGQLDSNTGVFSKLPAEVQEITKESVGAARVVAQQLGPNAAGYLSEVNEAFLSALQVGCLVAAGVAAAGAVVASRFLPAKAIGEQ